MFYFLLAEILQFLTLSNRIPRWNTAPCKTRRTVAIRFSAVRIYSAELGTSHSNLCEVIGAVAYPRAEGPRTRGFFSLLEGLCYVQDISAGCMNNPSLSPGLWADRTNVWLTCFGYCPDSHFPPPPLPPNPEVLTNWSCPLGWQFGRTGKG